MAQIHFIDGEKGGVGKSLFCRVLLQYCLDKGIDYQLVEADRTNPDVGSFYPDNCHQVFFSEQENKSFEVDLIFNLALKKPVIVNLPAQVYPMVTSWIKRNNLIEEEIAQEYRVQIYKWFLCTGGHDSIKLFLESLHEFKGKIGHIFVKNLGLCEDWQHLKLYEELKPLQKKYEVLEVELPKLSSMERNLIDQNQLTFADAIRKDSEHLPILSKQRVVNFLKESYKSIEKTGLVSVEAFIDHSVIEKDQVA
ncbi:MAG TPA: mobilization protein [Cyanobacteria bacterium UBA11162]|nr:mobilization protein [Cyanobacteria bacterium UBA11162]